MNRSTDNLFANGQIHLESNHSSTDTAQLSSTEGHPYIGPLPLTRETLRLIISVAPNGSKFLSSRVRNKLGLDQ